MTLDEAVWCWCGSLREAFVVEEGCTIKDTSLTAAVSLPKESGFFTVDSGGGICHVDAKLIELLGCPDASYVLGQPIETLLPGFSITQSQSRSQAAVQLCRPDGERRAAEVQVATLEGTGGRLYLLSVCLVEPTAVPQPPLEMLVRRVGHEFANLVTPMIGHIELCRMSGDDGGFSPDLLETFQAISRRLLIHVQNLHLLRQRPLGTLRRAELGAVTGRALEVVQETGLARRHEVVVSEDRQPAFIHSDSERLEQLIVNLILNAAESMPDPGRIDVRIRHDGQTVRLEIADQGVGIPHDMRQKIFEPLYSQKAVGGGLGLGLTIAQTIARHQNATIEISDQQPSGSLVLVQFPAVVL